MLQVEHRPYLCQACTLLLSYVSSSALYSSHWVGPQQLCILSLLSAQRASVLSLYSAQCLVVFCHKVQKKEKSLKWVDTTASYFKNLEC